MRHSPHGASDSKTLGEFVAQVGAVQRLNWADMAVSSITDDSRQVRQGALFVAIAGQKADGHDFIPEALARGAAALVCEKVPSPLPPCPVVQVRNSRLALSALAAEFYEHPARSLCMIGVTGTEGKGTTTELIWALLCGAGYPTGSLGTVHYRLGGRVLEASQTTPHPLSLHAMLREMVQAGLTHAAMEVSSHALVQCRTAHVLFRVGVLTNVTQDHLDFHKTPQAYVRAKQMLFEQLPPDGIAVLNADSPVCERYSRAARHASVLTYGVRNAADIRLEGHRCTVRGTRLLVRTPLQSYTIESPLIGDYNCENILAAIAVGFALSVQQDVVRRAMHRFEGVAGRLEKVEILGRPDLPTVIADYAHTPNALRRVLTTLRPLTRGWLICVFGCGGDRDRLKRPLMGQAATSLADFTVITADNSRSERTEDIIAEIVGGIEPHSGLYKIEPDRRSAIQTAIEAAGPDDVVALCGRGCERFQILGERRIPFDDRVVAREVLQHYTGAQRRTA